MIWKKRSGCIVLFNSGIDINGWTNWFKIRSQFKKLVQNFELKKVGVEPKSHQLTPLLISSVSARGLLWTEW